MRTKLTVLALCLLSTVSFAADPTLNETITYLMDKLNNPPTATWHLDKGQVDIYGMKVEWFNNGTLSIVATRRTSPAGKEPVVVALRYQFPLSTLSTEVAVNPAVSTVATSGPEAFGVVISSATDPKTPDGTIYAQEDDGMQRNVRKVTLWFRTQDTADHVAQAFQHAIELSGGKKDLFSN